VLPMRIDGLFELQEGGEEVCRARDNSGAHWQAECSCAEAESGGIARALQKEFREALRGRPGKARIYVAVEFHPEETLIKCDRKRKPRVHRGCTG